MGGIREVLQKLAVTGVRQQWGKKIQIIGNQDPSITQFIYDNFLAITYFCKYFYPFAFNLFCEHT